VKVDDNSELEGDISSAVHKCWQEVPTIPCYQPQQRWEMSTAQAGENERPREVWEMPLKLPRNQESPQTIRTQESLEPSKLDCKFFAKKDF
jgi:hypothetical protein